MPSRLFVAYASSKPDHAPSADCSGTFTEERSSSFSPKVVVAIGSVGGCLHMIEAQGPLPTLVRAGKD